MGFSCSDRHEAFVFTDIRVSPKLTNWYISHFLESEGVFMAHELILAVDDEAHILELISFNLEAEGYNVKTASNGEDALTACTRERPSLILLDLMLPGIDGMEVCRRLKGNTSTADIPIIMLTAKGDEVDKVLGLELGADDYVTKPFSVRELIARIKALLRRASAQTDDEGILRVGPLTIDTSNYEAFRNGEKLSLTLKEFELLKLLVISRGKVLTRDFLLDRIWGYEFYGETRTVDVHIRHIRQKLGDDASYIETIRGVGYKLNDKPEAKV